MTIAHNFSMFQGEDALVPFTVYQADGIKVMDITGFDMMFTLHNYGDPATVYFMKSSAMGQIQIVNGPAGQLTVAIAHPDTVSLRPNSYGYYIQRVDPGGFGELLSGLVSLKRSRW